MQQESPNPRITLAGVRAELERLIERRLSRPLNEDEMRLWNRLTGLEEELLERIHDPEGRPASK